MNHLSPNWLQQDLGRFHSDERQFYSAVSLAEECSGPELEKPQGFRPLPNTDFVGPTDFLNPHNAAHQRQNRGRDQLEWFAKEFKKIKLEG